MKKSNLPVNYNEKISVKIKNFISKLFNKNKIATNNMSTINKNDKINETFNLRENLKEIVKEDINSISDLSNDRLIEEYRKNPTILDNLPIEKLKELNKYYDELIQKCDEKLKL